MARDSYTAKDLAAVLEHLAKKATPGPWKSGSPNFSCTMDHQHGRGECRYEFRGWSVGEYWAKYIHRDKPMAASTEAEQVAGTWDYEEGGIQRREDAELIVALINNLPAILEAMRQCGPNDEAVELVKMFADYSSAMACLSNADWKRIRSYVDGLSATNEKTS